MPRLRVLLFVLIAYCLSLQAAWACAMPQCHDAMQQTDVTMELAEPHHHSHEADAATPAQVAHACDDCGVCQVSGNAILRGVSEPFAALPGRDAMVLQALTAPRSHITEPSLPPPRRHV